jgi:hypothetical protein
MTFYSIVLIIALIILIISLITSAMYLQGIAKSTPFPPNNGACPDYWSVVSGSGSGGGTYCSIPSSDGNGGINVGSIYNSTGESTLTASTTPGLSSDGTSIDFNNPAWATVYRTTGICGKKSWANKLGITWDGTSNYNQC